VTGTLINALAIVIGTLFGLARKTPVTAENQVFIKIVLGAATVFVGVRLTWISVTGGLWQFLWQLGIVILAMMLGKLTGRLLRLQKLSNRLGHFARDRIAAVQKSKPNGISDGVNVCAALFCAAPLGILGATSEALGGGPAPLIIKAVMEAMAAMGFVAMFGWGVGLSALSVLAFQGTIALLVSQFALPLLSSHGLVGIVNATAGMLIFSVSLLIFEVRRVEIADYLPSLVWAPLIMFCIQWLR
jgi:uncharacterized membrane protein YqgA involved in biofilm formation